MKNRVSKILNFIAFNLLFFALYLNFVHKDSSAMPVVTTEQNPSIHTTVIAENPEKAEVREELQVTEATPSKTVADNTIALKLSFN